MAITQSGQLSRASWATLSFTATETEVDNNNNSSNVQVQCTLTSTASTAYYQGYIDLYLYIDGNLVRGGVNSDYVNKSGTGTYINLDLGTYSVGHNSDGTKTTTIRVYSDWGGWGAVDLSGNLTLTNIPREAKFTTTDGNLTIGNSKDLNWTNNGNKWVRLYIEASGNIATIDLGQSTGYRWTPTSSQITSLYNKLGASGRNLGVAWIINTYNDSGYSSFLGDSVLYGTITAPVNYSGAVPTFSSSNISIAVTGNSVIKDPDGTTLQTNSWSSLLGNSCVLAGYSSVKGSVTTAATPKYSANMSYYTGTIDGNTSTINAVGDFPVFTNATDKTITVKAYDTRGDFKTVTKSLTYINSSYVTPVITNCTLGRINQVGTTATLNLTGTYYGTGYLSGQNNIGTANTLSVKYRYKATDSNTWSSWIDITNDCTISGTDFSYSGNLSTVFTADTSYNVQVMAYDYVATAYSSIILNNGNPSLHIVKNGLSVYGMYDTSEGGHLQVAGVSLDRNPLHYSCHLRADHPAQTITNYTDTPIQFPTAIYDPLEMHDVNTNPTRITVPENGCYYVYGMIRLSDAQSISDRIIRLRINGVDDVAVSAAADGAGRYGQSVMASYHLQAGDYVEIAIYQGGASSIGLTYASLGVILLGLD